MTEPRPHQPKTRKKSAASDAEKGLKRRKPHNAKEPEDFASLAELVQRIGAEPRKVLKDGREVTMSRMERTLRLAIEAGLQGKVRQLQMMLRLMARHPELVAPRYETSIFINGPLAGYGNENEHRRESG